MRISGWSSDVCSSDLGGAGEEALDGHAQLHPGEVRAEAPVDAGPEGEVPVALPVDDEHVGSLEVLGSRLPAGNAIRILSPFFIGQPAYSVSSATYRAMVTGL